MIVGAQKQEKKLKEFAKIAKQNFKGVNQTAVKGALRYGAQSALEKSEYSDWEEVAEESAEVRKEFFEQLIDEAKGHLRGAVGEENLEKVIDKMIQINNDKYV